MLSNQKSLFSLPENFHYLNASYMSPQLKTVEQIGIEQLKKKSLPFTISEEDFFQGKERLREHFIRLIGGNDPQQISILASVSFGIGTAMKNIPFQKGDEIVVLEEQFPSNYYTWQELSANQGVHIKTIIAPEIKEGRGKQWNEKILEAITSKTKCVALPIVHWADGTKFNLKEIRKRTNDVGAYLVIDGTQSIGAMPFSVEEIQPDALICCGYKWLLGAYGSALGYFSERLCNGTPLDNNWMNHEGAENFSNLVKYNPNFKAKAARYDVGQSSNFIHVAMLTEGIRQILEWTPHEIQDYCQNIGEESFNILRNKGCFIENTQYRGHHLIGVYLAEHLDPNLLKTKVSEKNISVSFRGNAIRISPHVYNSKEEIEKLVSCFI